MQATFGGNHRIRLVGDLFGSWGRLEVYHNGRWGTVCDDDFGGDDATLMCRILGRSSGVVDSSAGRQGTGQIWLDEVRIFYILNTSDFLLLMGGEY